MKDKEKVDVKNDDGVDVKLDGDDTQTPEPEGEKTYTEGELKALLQKESDRRVSQALETYREKMESQMAEKVAEEVKKAKRLATLSAEEREQELLKEKEQEILAREEAIKRKELEIDTIDVLNDEGLPLDFKDFLIGDSEEETLENINAFKDAWTEALQREVKKKLETPGLYRASSLSGEGANFGEELAKLGNVKKKKFKQ